MEGEMVIGNDRHQPMVELAMHGIEIANSLSVLELTGSAGEGRTGPIGLGILTITGHHYLRVPSIEAGDPAFFLILPSDSARSPPDPLQVSPDPRFASFCSVRTRVRGPVTTSRYRRGSGGEMPI
jgi:hypothetical protein